MDICKLNTRLQKSHLGFRSLETRSQRDEVTSPTWYHLRAYYYNTDISEIITAAITISVDSITDNYDLEEYLAERLEQTLTDNLAERTKIL